MIFFYYFTQAIKRLLLKEFHVCIYSFTHIIKTLILKVFYIYLLIKSRNQNTIFKRLSHLRTFLHYYIFMCYENTIIKRLSYLFTDSHLLWKHYYKTAFPIIYYFTHAIKSLLLTSHWNFKYITNIIVCHNSGKFIFIF